MHERFTEAVETTMREANAQAQRFNHEYIGTEHILLAAVEDKSCIALLRALGINPGKVVTEVMRVVQSGPDGATVGRLPLTPCGKRVIGFALDEAENLGVTKNITPPFLILGMLREQKGVAAQVLMNLGLKIEAARKTIDQLSRKTEPPDRGETLNESRVFSIEIPAGTTMSKAAAFTELLQGLVKILNFDQDEPDVSFIEN